MSGAAARRSAAGNPVSTSVAAGERLRWVTNAVPILKSPHSHCERDERFVDQCRPEDFVRRPVH